LILLAMRRRRDRSRALGGLLGALVAALALPAVAPAADPGPYLALGDSYTAGPLVLSPVGDPLGCLRSDHNYPSIVRAATGVTQFRDESCSAATTAHMTNAQSVPLGVHAPQFDALHPGLRLVTVGIGGNDVGLVGAAVSCIGTGLLAPTGTACRSSFAKPDGGDRLVEQIAATGPKIAATLQGIQARAPLARVLVVGYPAAAPANSNGCYPLVPASGDALTYLDEMIRRTNAMLAEQAAANDAEFVDTYAESVGHNVCTLPGTRWFEGLVPTAPTVPLHPNGLGEASMARSVLRVLGQPRPGPVLSALTRSRRTVTAGGALGLSYRLSRAAAVTFTLQRGRGRGRYTTPRRLLTADANRGANVLLLSVRRLGRRVGLYRLTVSVAGGEAQFVQFRIRRRR
jgi:lysophospholipase L1-like esterase